MSNIEELAVEVCAPSEYQSLLTLGASALDAIPGAVYLCDHEGWLVRYNSEAVELWGRAPIIGKNGDRFCGSHRLFYRMARRWLSKTAPWLRCLLPALRHAIRK